MSKEMTPKEALQMIQDNLTPRVLGILTVEFNVVKKALDRLEQLENENQELKERYKHRAEISSDLNESLKEYEKAIEKFIDYLNEEPNRQICKHSIKQVFNKFLEGVKENV